MDLARRLRERRERRNLKNSQVALYLGLSTAHISNLESGKREPSLDLLVQLADYYRCSVDYLLGVTDDPRPASKQALSTPALDAIDLIDSLPPEGRPGAVELLRAIIDYAKVGVATPDREESALPEPVDAREGGGVTFEGVVDEATQQKLIDRKNADLAVLKQILSPKLYERLEQLVESAHVLTEAEKMSFIEAARNDSIEHVLQFLEHNAARLRA